MADIDTLEREFNEISETRFWKEYVKKLGDAHLTLGKKLKRDNIGEATVMGKVWQEQMRMIENILDYPKSIFDAIRAKNEG